MKILLVSHTCISRTAGQPKAHCLAAFPDIELTVLVPDRMKTYGAWEDAEVPKNPNFRFVVGRTRWHSVRGLWYLQHYTNALPQLLADFQPDIIDIWEEPWSLACAQTIFLAKRLCPNTKIIVETEQNIWKKLPPPFQQFQSYCLQHADFVVARSREAEGVVQQKGYTGPSAVVPNAVDCSLFQPLPPAEKAVLRAKFGWGTLDSFVAGYVGRLVPEKGLADLVHALSLLPAAAHLVFVGEGSFRPALEELIRSLHLDARVHFTGSLPLSALPNAMNAMDCLVLPSRTTATWKEQFGRVLIEAGACALPVVGSDSGAIPEVIGPAGLTFPEGDPKALAACLRALMNDPSQRADYGRMGQSRAHALYSWQQVAAQMRALYNRVVES
jgi:glycosyltransferase involved in cell wall biosynthesis